MVAGGIIPGHMSTQTENQSWRLSDFDFELPESLVAQHPEPDRSGSRLLHVPPEPLPLGDRRFRDLPSLLGPDDLVVMNDTRVIPARLFGTKDTGGRVELLVERVLDERRAIGLLRASHLPKPGSAVTFDGVRATVVERGPEFWTLAFDEPVMPLLERIGRLPLPPYIADDPARDDATRYQTVYAREPGAVAAPTAGLHFDEAVLGEIAARGVRTATLTLHVGAGTFQPVRDDDVSGHVMHAERFEIPQATEAAIDETRRRGGRVLAVGTTTLRALESTGGRAGFGETRLFVLPGFRFTVVDRLLTNFHLPRSTLMMLVSAFAGVERIREAYRHAVADRYRFFSYGDAMLLERAG
jgi:S-adenosylmethionine:tRNA ribosyltransferase-isomerase